MRQVRVNFRLFLTLVAQPLRLQPDTLALNVQFFPFREQTPGTARHQLPCARRADDRAWPHRRSHNLYRWVQRYAPEMEKRLRGYLRSPPHRSWYVDETWVKVKGGGTAPKKTPAG